MIKKLVLLFLSFFDYFYQKKIIKFLKKNSLSEINLIFDVGAHKGESINLFLKNMKVENIVSFEASPLNFKYLENNKKNLEKKFPNTKIIIENLALSSDGRVVTFNQFNESSSSTINNINQESRYFKRKFNLLNLRNKKKIYESFKLKTETLDNYIYQNNFNRISFLKIDTEGYEYEILIGLKKRIKSVDTIMFEHHYDNMIIKEYTFSDINYLLKKNDFYQIFKSRMPFRKSFEYIYRRKEID
ncbi:FkbM family methyltransferase [Candidatus Pelagibacter sp. Uisw_137]|uniref:FkbM family methyltransferase n=1 Tax=Candidatus Pelagibacter sp. Uisw_137 TaxID=3230992 RepID=UPI0039EA252A